MKITTSFEKLKSNHACTERYRHLGKALGGITKYGRRTPINLLTILETNGVDDCLWALRATNEDCESLCRLMACDFAEAVLPVFEKHHPNDMRPRKAIETARKYAKGESTTGELNASSAAASAAAWAAASSASSSASSAAAWAAAWDATVDKQKEIIIRYLSN